MADFAASVGKRLDEADEKPLVGHVLCGITVAVDLMKVTPCRLPLTCPQILIQF